MKLLWIVGILFFVLLVIVLWLLIAGVDESRNRKYYDRQEKEK